MPILILDICRYIFGVPRYVFIALRPVPGYLPPMKAVYFKLCLAAFASARIGQSPSELVPYAFGPIAANPVPMALNVAVRDLISVLADSDGVSAYTMAVSRSLSLRNARFIQICEASKDASIPYVRLLCTKVAYGRAGAPFVDSHAINRALTVWSVDALSFSDTVPGMTMGDAIRDMAEPGEILIGLGVISAEITGWSVDVYPLMYSARAVM